MSFLHLAGGNASALTTVSVLALASIGCSAQALAQDVPATTQDGGQADSGNQGVQDIIVTASRRSVNLQKESRSVDVLSSADLTRNAITDPVAVQALVPGLSVAQNGIQLQVYIRGVGDRTITSANDPAVALNVDGVYYPKSYEVSGAFFDLERIEVLKGPQGTLYGRNASAGAINLIAAKPVFTVGGFGEVEVGNYGAIRTTGAINVPLSSTLAVRASGQMVRRNGYLSDGYNDEKSEAARVQLLWKPDSATSLLISGFYSHLGGKGSAAVIIDPTFKADPWSGPTDPAVLARIKLTNPGSEVQPKSDGFQDITTYAFAATFQHDLGWATLTVLPSYVGSTQHNRGYGALTVVTAEDTKSDQYTLETRLSSPADASIKWVLGALGSKENVVDTQSSLIAPTYILFNPSPKRDDKTLAVFGEANASITDRLRAIAGARYTYEKKDVVSYGYNDFATTPFPNFPIPAPALGTPSGGTRTDKATNFRLGVEYDVAPASMLFATVSTGFKAGGFYIDVPPNGYKPEKLTAYEAGIKNRFFDRRLQLNVEGFYWKYKDKQETFISISNSGSGFAQQTANAGQATLYGVDVSAIAQLTAHDVLSAEGEYLHTNYDSYVNSVIDGGITNCAVLATNSNGEITYDCSGKPLAHSPSWSGRVSYEHTQPLKGGGTITFNAQMRFSSSYFLQNDFTDLEHFNGYRVSDASLTWASENGKVSFTAFIKNIEDKAIYTGATQSSALAGGAVAIINPPRTYGGRFRIAF